MVTGCSWIYPKAVEPLEGRTHSASGSPDLLSAAAERTGDAFGGLRRGRGRGSHGDAAREGTGCLAGPRGRHRLDGPPSHPADDQATRAADGDYSGTTPRHTSVPPRAAAPTTDTGRFGRRSRVWWARVTGAGGEGWLQVCGGRGFESSERRCGGNWPTGVGAGGLQVCRTGRGSVERGSVDARIRGTQIRRTQVCRTRVRGTRGERALREAGWPQADGAATCTCPLSAH